MENKLHVVTVIIKKPFKNKDKEHLEESRCSFCMRNIIQAQWVIGVFLRLMSRILVVELGLTGLTSTSRDVRGTFHVPSVISVQCFSPERSPSYPNC